MRYLVLKDCFMIGKESGEGTRPAIPGEWLSGDRLGSEIKRLVAVGYIMPEYPEQPKIIEPPTRKKYIAERASPGKKFVEDVGPGPWRRG